VVHPKTPPLVGAEKQVADGASEQGHRDLERRIDLGVGQEPQGGGSQRASRAEGDAPAPALPPWITAEPPPVGLR
jgi:hypothetical protein